jgi:hypothetical protein
MRIILDYLYATQLIGILTTFAVCICILAVLCIVQRSNVNIKKHPVKGYLLWLIYIIPGFLFICMIIQISCNPFSIGRAGTIHQAAILENTIVFVDSYAQGGAEFGDTASMVRIWILDRRNGELLKRKKVDSYELIVAANETSLLIHEDCDWYITDSNFNTTTSLIKNLEYNGRKVHTCTFSKGILKISFKDFSEFQMSVPFVSNGSKLQNTVKLIFLDTDHDTYQVTCCDEKNIIWRRDQSIGTLLEYTPEIKYESSTNDLYLLWTQNKLVALSKLTGKTIWSFLY